MVVSVGTAFFIELNDYRLKREFPNIGKEFYNHKTTLFETGFIN